MIVRYNTANRSGFRPWLKVQGRLGESIATSVAQQSQNSGVQPAPASSDTTNPGTVTASDVWSQLQAKGAQVYQDLQQTVTLPVVGSTPLIFIVGGAIAVLAIFSGKDRR